MTHVSLLSAKSPLKVRRAQRLLSIHLWARTGAIRALGEQNEAGLRGDRYRRPSSRKRPRSNHATQVTRDYQRRSPTPCRSPTRWRRANPLYMSTGLRQLLQILELSSTTSSASPLEQANSRQTSIRNSTGHKIPMPESSRTLLRLVLGQTILPQTNVSLLILHTAAGQRAIPSLEMAACHLRVSANNSRYSGILATQAHLSGQRRTVLELPPSRPHRTARTRALSARMSTPDSWLSSYSSST